MVIAVRENAKDEGRGERRKTLDTSFDTVRVSISIRFADWCMNKSTVGEEESHSKTDPKLDNVDRLTLSASSALLSESYVTSKNCDSTLSLPSLPYTKGFQSGLFG